MEVRRKGYQESKVLSVTNCWQHMSGRVVAADLVVDSSSEKPITSDFGATGYKVEHSLVSVLENTDKSCSKKSGRRTTCSSNRIARPTIYFFPLSRDRTLF